jgi:deoxyribodipyrimidine photo-lyase
MGKRSNPEKEPAVVKRVATNNGKKTNALMWFRTDLRMTDNPALTAATLHAASSGTTLAVYILSPQEFLSHDLSPVKIDFILRHLHDLRASLLSKLCIPLLVLTAPTAAHVLSQLQDMCEKYQIDTVYCNAEYEVDEGKRDNKVEKMLNGHGVEMKMFHDQCVVPPGHVLSKQGTPYSVFTPFKVSFCHLHLVTDKSSFTTSL